MQSYIEVKSENSRVEVVTSLKGFAILTIVLMHLIQNFLFSVPEIVSKAASLGGTGVHIFFICSAIGLYMSQLKKPQSFVTFLRKRFLFIYVPYFVVVLICCLVPFTYEGDDRWLAFLSHTFLYKAFIPKYEESFGAPFWFISTLFQLYLLFIPMCFLKKKIKNNWVFFGIFFLISVAWWIITTVTGMNNERIWNSFCLQYIWEFALGMIVGEMLFNGKIFKLNILLLLGFAVVGLGLQALMALKSEALKSFNDIPAVIGYGSLALLIVNIPGIKWFVKKISNVSYEIYLIHLLIMTVIFHFVTSDSLLIQVAVGLGSLVAVYLIAFLYNLLLKNTLYKLKK